MPVSMWMAAPPDQPLSLAERVPFGEFAEVADHRPAVQFGEGSPVPAKKPSST